MYKIVSVKAIEDYKIIIEFINGEKKIFDVTPYIKGNWYGKLKEKSYFDNVRISGNTVCWSDGQDIAPHELYDLSVNIKNDEITKE